MSRRPEFENDRPDRRHGPYRHAKSYEEEGGAEHEGSDGPSEGGYWLFGIHSVRDALLNPARVKRRLILHPQRGHAPRRRA